MSKQTYTHPIIKGIPHSNMLPDGVGLVLEGGGTRGFFSAGVFEAFMEAGIMFPYIAAVSAGSANAYSYISGQPGRGRSIIEHYVGNPNYVGFRNIIKHGSLFGYNFIFDTIPTKHIFFDREVFNATNIRFLIGTFDCNTGDTIWFDKPEQSENYIESIASCSVPLVAKIVKHRGLELLDGGIASPISIEKSIADGNKFHVIVLTRNKGYISKPTRSGRVLDFMYKKYPKLISAIKNRHEIYNKQLALCEQLVKEGKAIIIRPKHPVKVGRSTRDVAQLLALHDEGLAVGRQAIEFFRNQLVDFEKLTI